MRPGVLSSYLDGDQVLHIGIEERIHFVDANHGLGGEASEETGTMAAHLQSRWNKTVFKTHSAEISAVSYGIKNGWWRCGFSSVDTPQFYPFFCL